MMLPHPSLLALLAEAEEGTQHLSRHGMLSSIPSSSRTGRPGYRRFITSQVSQSLALLLELILFSLHGKNLLGCGRYCQCGWRQRRHCFPSCYSVASQVPAPYVLCSCIRLFVFCTCRHGHADRHQLFDLMLFKQIYVTNQKSEWTFKLVRLDRLVSHPQST